MKKILLHSIKFYQQALGPLLPRVCRFVPSCSQYAYEAIEHYGIGRGLAAAAWRVLRCNPLCTGGYDPVRPARGGSGSGLNHGHRSGAAHE